MSNLISNLLNNDMSHCDPLYKGGQMHDAV